jgi:hypothetical protein
MRNLEMIQHISAAMFYHENLLSFSSYFSLLRKKEVESYRKDRDAAYAVERWVVSHWFLLY